MGRPRRMRWAARTITLVLTLSGCGQSDGAATQSALPDVAPPIDEELAEKARVLAETAARLAAEEDAAAVERAAYLVTPRGRSQNAAKEAIASGTFVVDGAPCELLVEHLGFDAKTCSFLENLAAGQPGNLNGREFQRFLRSQKVAIRRGQILGWYDQSADEYEARIAGRTSILIATETSFQTTGGFRMWAQRIGESEETLNNGREVDVPLYREWVLYGLILEAARARPPERQSYAQFILGHLVDRWEESYCSRDQEDPMSLCDGAPEEATDSPPTD